MDVLDPAAAWSPPPPPPDYRAEECKLRLDPAGRRFKAAEIERSDGVEVASVWTWDQAAGWYTDPIIYCRGTRNRVACPSPQAGKLALHNHPSGDLLPEGADLEAARIFAAHPGASFAICDNSVTRLNIVVPGYLLEMEREQG